MTANHHENNGVDRQRVEALAILATTRGLDQLTAEEEAELASALAKPASKELQGASEQSSRVAAVVAAAITANELPAPSPELRTAIDAELNAPLVAPAKAPIGAEISSSGMNWLRVTAVVLTVAGLLVVALIPAVQMAREKASRQLTVKDWLPNAAKSAEEDGDLSHYLDPASPANQPADPVKNHHLVLTAPRQGRDSDGNGPVDDIGVVVRENPSETIPHAVQLHVQPTTPLATAVIPPATNPVPSPELTGERFGNTIAGPVPDAKASYGYSQGFLAPVGDKTGGGGPGMSAGMSGMGLGGMGPADGRGDNPRGMSLGEREKSVTPYYLNDSVQYFESARGWAAISPEKEKELADLTAANESREVRRQRLEVEKASGEAYARIRENAFRLVRDQPLSTFSIDVDTASYANMRRFLTAGQLPPKDAVRIEELLNYFSYDYPQPQEKDPFSVNLEVTDCPWRPENRLLRVGLKGRDVARQQRAMSNLVFLIDVSGSMQPENKLPLVKTALRMLVQELTENDRVSIVTYAGDAGLKLPSTNGTEQSRILNTIDSLSAGGSTHGSAGIELAYEQASAYFIRGGTNRVILLTDGDLNVGITDDDALVRLIQQKAKSGVFLTVLGVGDGNLKDSKMEKLADHGNGVYAYLDSVREARKVLVEQLSGSLVTIAKDVKLQIEFNPAQVQAYRLVGYENRVLANRDFNDDTKDAGEIGAGHTVTALYELVPTNVPVPAPGEPLKYQPQRVEESSAIPSGQVGRELLTLKLRFKHPEADRSELRDYPLTDRGGKFGQASADFRFATSVAMFGLVLRNSQYRGSANLAAVEEIATSSLGQDPRGYRSEFVDLVRKAEQLK